MPSLPHRHGSVLPSPSHREDPSHPSPEVRIFTATKPYSRRANRNPQHGPTFCDSVGLTVSEMNDRALAAALEERRLDVALPSNNAVWHHAASLPLYRDRLLAAFPVGHHL